MKPAPFAYHKPQSLDEALALLSEGAEEGALILAGGQSLVPMMALRVAYPPALIDINGIAGLDAVEVSGTRVRLGATVRHAAFHDPGFLPEPLGPMLHAVAENIAHYPIRQRGTFCGSLAHADPSSEWCLVASVLDAEIELRSAGGERRLRPADYFEGPMMTLREPDEMLVGVTLARPAPGTCWGFYEFNRRAGDFALGMALVLYEIEDGVIANARLGLGGIEEHPRRIATAEAVLNGRAPDEAVFAEAAEAAMAEVEPMSDATTSADYRRDLAGTVLRRALAAASRRTTHEAA
ncbi:FAD binding domain-containing protein [Salipiger sp. P9]|uniref:FAD binding domain-containing protein n=1 Tax=Salipiger pentaromativorans TaxID=2943193 RepID=UPI002157BC80|nr:FAD binding domain-containing protein [Salipiger pentaromativorans]MCR8549217.1 FAD binding domain-containing protein [Salipiger pentaromativorans]